MPLKVLIIGAGVCGPAFATLLRRADPSLTAYDITIIERSPKLRSKGLQIDLRAQGIPIVKKMGLIDAIRSRVVPEQGVCFVDGRGRPFATFGKNDSGRGAQAMTSEYEIMRGDLVDVLYRASLGLSPYKNNDDDGNDDDDGNPTTTEAGNVRYQFGVTVAQLTQPEDGSAVEVTFSDGRRATFDLVVGADGQGSRTRRALLESGGGSGDGDTCFRSLGMFTALFLVPRDAAADDGWMRCHMMPGRRMAMTRSADEKAPTQVYLAVQTDPGAAAATAGNGNGNGNEKGAGAGEDKYGIVAAMRQQQSDVAAQREAWARAFAGAGAGWRVPAFVDALRHRVRDEDFYAAEIGQVRSPALARGRVALLGDAGYCPSPITGMGTTLSLTGAYVLAGELAAHRHAPAGVPAALRAYADAVRPFVDEAQRLTPGVPRILYAESRWGVWLLTTVIALLSRLRIIDFLVRILPENKGGLAIPEYPELNLGN